MPNMWQVAVFVVVVGIGRTLTGAWIETPNLPGARTAATVAPSRVCG